MTSVVDKLKANMPIQMPLTGLQVGAPPVFNNQSLENVVNNEAPQYRLKDAVLKNDLKQAQINAS